MFDHVFKILKDCSNCFVFWSRIFVLFEPYIRFLIFSSVRVTEWPPIGE